MNTTMVTTARATTACIAAVLGFNAAEAFAGSHWYDESVAGTPPRYIVRFYDLDLSKIEGAATLYARLRYAARTACESIQTQQPLLVEKYRACVDKASDRAGPAQLGKAH
jgi:UrcA family protein